jgi:hypothetical protein
MKVLLVYRPNSEYATHVEEFVREFEHRDSSRHVELIDVDSKEGINIVSLYDIVQYPALLVLTDDGKMVQMWTGTELPLMDELASYASSGGNLFLASPE